MTRVNKSKARKLWNDGARIMIVPCKMNPKSPWLGNPWISKNEFNNLGYNTDFDSIVNSHEYYNCNNETGKYCAYYTEG